MIDIIEWRDEQLRQIKNRISYKLYEKSYDRLDEEEQSIVIDKLKNKNI